MKPYWERVIKERDNMELQDWRHIKKLLIKGRERLAKTHILRPCPTSPDDYRADVIENSIFRALDAIDESIKRADKALMSDRKFSAMYDYDIGPEDLRDDWPHAINGRLEAA